MDPYPHSTRRSESQHLMILTWLPMPDFKDSIRYLSDRHLEQQRIDVLNILEHLHDVEVSELESGDRHPLTDDSPVVMMWKGYEAQLAEYGLEACEEWCVRQRIKEDPLYAPILFHMECATGEEADLGKPNWMGEVDFHISHQALLVALNPAHYTFKVSRGTEANLVWPVSRYAKAG